MTCYSFSEEIMCFPLVIIRHLCNEACFLSQKPTDLYRVTCCKEASALFDKLFKHLFSLTLDNGTYRT